MRNRWPFLVATLATLAISVTVLAPKGIAQPAGLLRSAELVSHCKVVDDYCKGYLGGYIDSAALYQMTMMIDFASENPPLPGNLPPFCPASVGAEAFAKSYVAYIGANPAKQGDVAGTTVLEMLSANYPCSH